MLNQFRAAMLSLPLALSPLAVSAQEAQGTVLSPKIQGVEFRIDCARDFPNGEPTLEFLGRLDSRIHGAQNPNGDNVNLYTNPDRENIIEGIIEDLPQIQQVMIRAQMAQLFRAYDSAQDKEAYLKALLQSKHQIGEPFYDQVGARCGM